MISSTLLRKPSKIVCQQFLLRKLVKAIDCHAKMNEHTCEINSREQLFELSLEKYEYKLEMGSD